MGSSIQSVNVQKSYLTVIVKNNNLLNPGVFVSIALLSFS